MALLDRTGVVKLFPVPIDVPPDATLNQVMEAPAEGVTERVIDPGPQNVPADTEEIEGDATTDASTADRAEVQPLLVACTKYVVLEEMDGVVKLVPVPIEVPPVEAANQDRVPAEAVAPNTTVPVPQVAPGVVAVMVGIGFTVPVTAVREAEVQPPLVAST